MKIKIKNTEKLRNDIRGKTAIVTKNCLYMEQELDRTLNPHISNQLKTVLKGFIEATTDDEIKVLLLPSEFETIN